MSQYEQTTGALNYLEPEHLAFDDHDKNLTIEKTYHKEKHKEVYTKPSSSIVEPVQIYFALSAFTIGMVILDIWLKNHLHDKGQKALEDGTLLNQLDPYIKNSITSIKNYFSPSPPPGAPASFAPNQPAGNFTQTMNEGSKQIGHNPENPFNIKNLLVNGAAALSFIPAYLKIAYSKFINYPSLNVKQETSPWDSTTQNTYQTIEIPITTLNDNSTSLPETIYEETPAPAPLQIEPAPISRPHIFMISSIIFPLAIALMLNGNASADSSIKIEV